MAQEKITKLSNDGLIAYEKMALLVLENISNKEATTEERYAYSVIGNIRNKLLEEMAKRVRELHF